MPLDPQCRTVLEPINAAPPLPLDEMAPETLRALFKAMSIGGPGQPVSRVEDRTLPGPAGDLPVRIYWPHQSADDRALPALAYFHGGGFVVCDLDTHDGTCRALANGVGCVVVSVDYRLAPESPFPAAPEDCYAATAWLAGNARGLGADPERLAVAGDSAGGNLAAAVALMARERGGPPLRHQLLIYPVTDCAFDTDSYRENADGYLLTRDIMRWFWGHYLDGDEDAAHPLASPLRAADLSGLPAATVLTAEYDPLRDEGEAYAARLRQAGVPVEVVRFEGMIHGFFGMTDAIDRAREAQGFASERLRAAFSSPAARL